MKRRANARRFLWRSSHPAFAKPTARQVAQADAVGAVSAPLFVDSATVIASQNPKEESWRFVRRFHPALPNRLD